MAYGVVAPPTHPERVEEPAGLTFLGLQGAMDPPRAGVREAIAGCQESGIRVVMITGDHAATARAIGERLGIVGPRAPVLTGAELGALDAGALRARVREVSVYARVAPEHKLRVVQALQDQGEVVAVTGDGVNDAPALRTAEIGVAMGKSGTDVAREAADMVLADDNFVSIYAAVEEGRVTFDNLRKVTFFLISTGAAEVLAILTTLILQWPLPFLPGQILWLNLVTNGLQDVALAFEPGEPGVLQRPPRRKAEGIVSRLLWERTLVTGLVMAAGTLLLFGWELRASDDVGRARTVALTTMVLFQVFHVGNCRSERRSVLALSPWSNPFLFLATAAALLVHVAALHLPPTRLLLRLEPLDLDAWVRMVAVAATILAVIEAHKLLRGGRPRRAPPREPGAAYRARTHP
jgi:Ca2+-transporting ATPase